MIPAGYMAKRVRPTPIGLNASRVDDIYSVSRCMSEFFGEFTDLWKHNQFWLFDSPELILEVAATLGENLSGTKLFYYEAYELEYAERERLWRSFDLSRPEIG